MLKTVEFSVQSKDTVSVVTYPASWKYFVLGLSSPRDSIRPAGEFRTKELSSKVGIAREDIKRDAVATVAAHVHKCIAAYQMSAN